MKESFPNVQMRTRDPESQADTLHHALFPAGRTDNTAGLARTTAIALAVLVLGVAGVRNPDRIHREPAPIPDTLVVAPRPLPQPLLDTPNPPPREPTEPIEPSGGETPQPRTPTTPVVFPTPALIAPGGVSPLPSVPPFRAPASIGPAKPTPASTPTPLRPNSKDGGYYPAPSYPPAANLQKLEGEVVLWIRVDPNGRIVSVDVKRTSGHSTLDRAAADTVRNRWRFPAGPERLFEWPCAFVFPRSPGSNPQ